MYVCGNTALAHTVNSTVAIPLLQFHCWAGELQLNDKDGKQLKKSVASRCWFNSFKMFTETKLSLICICRTGYRTKQQEENCISDWFTVELLLWNLMCHRKMQYGGYKSVRNIKSDILIARKVHCFPMNQLFHCSTN